MNNHRKGLLSGLLIFLIIGSGLALALNHFMTIGIYYEVVTYTNSNTVILCVQTVDREGNSIAYDGTLVYSYSLIMRGNEKFIQTFCREKLFLGSANLLWSLPYDYELTVTAWIEGQPNTCIYLKTSTYDEVIKQASDMDTNPV